MIIIILFSSDYVIEIKTHNCLVDVSLYKNKVAEMEIESKCVSEIFELWIGPTGKCHYVVI